MKQAAPLRLLQYTESEWEDGQRTFSELKGPYPVDHVVCLTPRTVTLWESPSRAGGLPWLLMPRALGPLCYYLYTRKGRRTGIAFIDSTSLAACDNHRIATHKVFAGLAMRGKTSMGWFFGFARHLIVNDEGELLAFRLTPGHVDDRQPVARLAGEIPHHRRATRHAHLRYR